MKASPVKQKNVEDIKLDFVLTVYEAITKQIQQMDLKISILLSWNGVIAVMISREIAFLFGEKVFRPFPVAVLIISIAGLILSALYTYRVLKPRVGKMEASHAGLLFAGDILRLGRNGTERMKKYMEQLLAIADHEQLYRQYVKSIVLISNISVNKNALFNRALAATATSFFLLSILIALRGLKVG